MNVLCVCYNDQTVSPYWDNIMQQNFQYKIGPEYWTRIKRNAFWHPPFRVCFWRWTFHMLYSVVYANPCLDLNYSQVSMPTPVRFPQLLWCTLLTISKDCTATVPFMQRELLKMQQSAKVTIFSATVHTMWKGLACQVVCSLIRYTVVCVLHVR